MADVEVDCDFYLGNFFIKNLKCQIQLKIIEQEGKKVKEKAVEIFVFAAEPCLFWINLTPLQAAHPIQWFHFPFR